MRPLGFSTGALAFGNFRRALALLEDVTVAAIELSALRRRELLPLLTFVQDTDLSRFTFISVHAPSGVAPDEEQVVVEQLGTFAERGWPIIVHPDAITRFEYWDRFADLLCVENMDRRKPTGRTSEELSAVFELLPRASMCFDIAHARQFDTSMTEAYRILRDHSGRIRQIHISEVNTSSRHDHISLSAARAFQEVAPFIPPEVPAILEVPATEAEAQSQLQLAAAALDPSAVLRDLVNAH